MTFLNVLYQLLLALFSGFGGALIMWMVQRRSLKKPILTFSCCEVRVHEIYSSMSEFYDLTIYNDGDGPAIIGSPLDLLELGNEINQAWLDFGEERDVMDRIAPNQQIKLCVEANITSPMKRFPLSIIYTDLYNRQYRTRVTLDTTTGIIGHDFVGRVTRRFPSLRGLNRVRLK